MVAKTVNPRRPRPELHHERRSARRIVVECNVSGRDLRTVVNEIQRRVGLGVRLRRVTGLGMAVNLSSEAAASERLGLLSILVIAGID